MRMLRYLLAATILAVPAAAAAQGEPVTAPAPANGDLSFARVYGSPSLNGPVPREVKLSPDGRFLTLLRGRADDREQYDLWGYDRTTGQWTMLVDSRKLGSGKDVSEA